MNLVDEVDKLANKQRVFNMKAGCLCRWADPDLLDFLAATVYTAP